MAEGEADGGGSDLDALSRQMSYALVKNCDMNEEMRTDCVDLVITAIERYANSYEVPSASSATPSLAAAKPPILSFALLSWEAA